MASTPIPIPILLLKTPSNPPETDSYTKLFSAHQHQHPATYNPIHIPVLTHKYATAPLLPLLTSPSLPYGGLIFTSQRAVSAFSLALSQALDTPSFPSSQRTRFSEWSIPIYAVGPATTAAVKGVCAVYLPACESRVRGEEAGTGEALAHIILEDYNDRQHQWGNDGELGEKKPLLFLTGEKHRDIIPRMLQSSSLGPEARIKVVEIVIYSTAAVEGFEASFEHMLGITEEEARKAGARWVVVFSAPGGESMLRVLGWLDEETGRVKDDWDKGGGDEGRRTFVASIGPTTRDYLRKAYGFEVDVCASTPSAEGVRVGIERFMREKNSNTDGRSG